MYDNLSDISFSDASSPAFQGIGRPIDISTPVGNRRLDATFDRRHSSANPPALNSTFDKPHLNTTYGMVSSGDTPPILNETVKLGNRTTILNDSSPANATFTRRKTSHDRSSANWTESPHRISRDSSRDHFEDERLSNTSDGSVSHRLNDVGDVQLLAKMQEESMAV